MASPTEKILEHALALSEEERRALAERLRKSLPRESAEVITRAWDDEVLDRLESAERGEVRGAQRRRGQTMGFTMCPRHGRSSLAFACAHLRAVRFPLTEGGVRVQLVVRGADGDDELWFEHAVCRDCAAEVRIHDGEQPFDELEARLNAVAGDPECASCEREDLWNRDQMPVAMVFIPKQL